MVLERRKIKLGESKNDDKRYLNRIDFITTPSEAAMTLTDVQSNDNQASWYDKDVIITMTERKEDVNEPMLESNAAYGVGEHEVVGDAWTEGESRGLTSTSEQSNGDYDTYGRELATPTAPIEAAASSRIAKRIPAALGASEKAAAERERERRSNRRSRKEQRLEHMRECARCSCKGLTDNDETTE